MVVRSDNARAAALAPDGSVLYYIVPLENLNGVLDYELRAARPEDGEARLLARISGERVPIWQGLHPVISRDGKFLLTGAAAGSVRQWDLATGKQVRELARSWINAPALAFVA